MQPAQLGSEAAPEESRVKFPGCELAVHGTGAVQAARGRPLNTLLHSDCGTNTCSHQAVWVNKQSSLASAIISEVGQLH